MKIKNKMAVYLRNLTENAVPTLNLPVGLADLSESIEIKEGNSQFNGNKRNKCLKKIAEENEKLSALIKRKEDIIGKLKVERDMQKNKLCEIKKSLRNSTPRNYLPVMKQKQLLLKVLTENQIKLLYGKSKAHWTNHEMAIAYTIRNLSSRKFYDYLTQKLNFPLPGLSSVRRWFAINYKSKKFNGASKKIKRKE